MARHIVTIVSASVPEYRLAFLNRLRAALLQRDVDLRVVYGRASPLDEGRWHSATLEWGTPVDNRVLSLRSKHLIWQPCVRLAAQSHLVIVEQASKLITNHLLFVLHKLGRFKLAFWGHGKNLRSHAVSRVGEAIKTFESKRVHWWFAHTTLTVELLQAIGFPPDRITLVENTIDIRTLENVLARMTSQDLAVTQHNLGLNGNNRALYIGGMYPEKRLPFLLEAATIIRSHLPDFELLLVGAGSDEQLARRAASRFDWIHYLGPQLGVSKVPYFALCRLLLLPGLVGLTIVDSFALKLPMLTIDVPYHSPEIAYLRNHENGVMLPPGTTPPQYAQAATALLADEQRRGELVRGCTRSASSYGLEKMVGRFSKGIELALAQNPSAR